MNQNSHWYADRPCPQCSRVRALADQAASSNAKVIGSGELNRALSPAQTEGLTVAAVALVLQVAALAVAIWRWRR
jgi:hypothetical protein